MKRIEKFLNNKGVQVITFYGKAAKWSDIVKKGQGANMLIYSGHGTTSGKNDSFGGLCLDKIVSVSTIQKEIKLAKNSMVLFQSVCGGAALGRRPPPAGDGGPRRLRAGGSGPGGRAGSSRRPHAGPALCSQEWEKRP